MEDKNIFLDASLSKIPYLTEIVKNLGGEIKGISVPEVDLQNRKELKKIENLSKGTTVIVGNGQFFEKANALRKTQSQILISDQEGSSFALNENVTVVSLKNITLYGYEGIIEFIRGIKNAIRINEYYKLDTLSSKYKQNWLNKSGNWYVKQEVR